MVTVGLNLTQGGNNGVALVVGNGFTFEGIGDKTSKIDWGFGIGKEGLG